MRYVWKCGYILKTLANWGTLPNWGTFSGYWLCPSSRGSTVKHKTAEEVVNQLFDIICLLGPPHILQSDNGRQFKDVDLAKMIRELWPGCRIVHGKPRHPQSQGSVVNKESPWFVNAKS